MIHGISQAQPIHYTTESIKRLQKKCMPGRVIYLRGRNDLQGFGDDEPDRARKYTVVRAFPHHVSCLSESGFRESFRYLEIERRRVRK